MDRLGHYIVGRRLGAGAMGEVWLGEHDLLRVSRALKILPERFSGSSGFRDRFLSEGRVLATLDHGNIVRVHDMGIEGSTYFIAMDFVSPDGSASQSLEDLLRGSGGRLAADAVLPVFRQVCGAVAYAHERGVIHRDLKPSNVLMGPGGSPRVSDFGLARVVCEDVIHESIAASLSGSLGVQSSLAGVGGGAPLDPSMGGGATMGGDGGSGSGSGVGRGSSSESLVGTYHYIDRKSVV